MGALYSFNLPVLSIPTPNRLVKCVETLSHKQSTCIFFFTVERGRVHSFLEKQGGSGVTAHRASAVFILPLRWPWPVLGIPTSPLRPSGVATSSKCLSCSPFCQERQQPVGVTAVGPTKYCHIIALWFFCCCCSGVLSLGWTLIYHPNQDTSDSEVGSAIAFKLRQQVFSRTVQANLDIWSPCLSLVLD